MTIIAEKLFKPDDEKPKSIEKISDLVDERLLEDMKHTKNDIKKDRPHYKKNTK